jgi:hypothetical protein
VDEAVTDEAVANDVTMNEDAGMDPAEVNDESLIDVVATVLRTSKLRPVHNRKILIMYMYIVIRFN